MSPLLGGADADCNVGNDFLPDACLGLVHLQRRQARRLAVPDLHGWDDARADRCRVGSSSEECLGRVYNPSILRHLDGVWWVQPPAPDAEKRNNARSRIITLRAFRFVFDLVLLR